MAKIISGDRWRFSFLTERLVRLERSESGVFEDGLTSLARCRDFGDVQVTCRREGRYLEMETEALQIRYDGEPFSGEGLCVRVKGPHGDMWHYGDRLDTLGGTARTLDGVDGEIQVGDGVISRRGFSVLSDSDALLLSEDGVWVPRKHAEEDFYFFGYGHDYKGAIRDFYRLSGPVPLLPKYALGNWWSRYHRYTQQEYLELMQRFRDEGIPLSVAVIDMDWHVTDTPYGTGWTGFSWNRDLFPDPEGFLRALHDMGLMTTLNLHPADGVRPDEEAYGEMCRALGRNPEDTVTIPFDAGDPAFMQAYFDVLLRPLERMGVDFWWIDWQQGTRSSMPGLDPLWALNEAHFRDMEKRGARGLILSRYAGPGSHRYPVGFSGDTVMTWASLRFQSEFTIRAGNIGYPWWSHDIGGHMGGQRDDELSVRWLQLGVFSPILRLHSTDAEFMSKEPWSFSQAAGDIMKGCLRLRNRLVPYLFSESVRVHQMGENLVRGMYLEYPEAEEAYEVSNEFFFGSSLLVCPVTEKMNPSLQMAPVDAWLPAGDWVDLETGQTYTGGRKLRLFRTLSSIPVLARPGTVLPLLREDGSALPGGQTDEMDILVVPGKDGAYDMYDEGEDGQISTVHFAWEDAARTLRVSRKGSAAPSVLHVGFPGNREAIVCTLSSGTDDEAFEIRLPRASWDWKAEVHARLQRFQMDNAPKERIWKKLQTLGRSPALLGEIRCAVQDADVFDCLFEAIFSGED